MRKTIGGTRGMLAALCSAEPKKYVCIERLVSYCSYKTRCIEKVCGRNGDRYETRRQNGTRTMMQR